MLRGYYAGRLIFVSLSRRYNPNFISATKFFNLLRCRVWVSNKIAKTFTHEVAMAYRKAFSLRQRMLDCIQHLEYYMMIEVVEPNWLKFINKMSKVSNLFIPVICKEMYCLTRIIMLLLNAFIQLVKLKTGQ